MACGCCENPSAPAIFFAGEMTGAQSTRDWCGFDGFIEEDERRKYRVQTSTVSANKASFGYADYSFESNPGEMTTDQRWHDINLVSSHVVVRETVGCGAVEVSNEFEQTTIERYQVYQQDYNRPSYRCETVATTVNENGNYTVTEENTPSNCRTKTDVCRREVVVDNTPPDTRTVRYYFNRSITFTACPPPNPQEQVSGGGNHYSKDELSGEVQKPDIKSIAISEMPDPEPFIEGSSWSSPASAYTETETGSGFKIVLSAMVQKVAVKVKHGPSPTCYLRLWLRKRFYPKGWGGDYEATEVLESWEYVWTGTGNPCFANDDKWAGHDDNQISTPTYDLDIPEEEGEVRVEIVKASLLAGYTPADPADDGTRPNPDLMPNYFPYLSA